ncbi:MAG: STAS domain-containing protein [Fibrobacteres bacterium]|nr:STAS domain-containing protein [Fibrobacterota bacterium]
MELPAQIGYCMQKEVYGWVVVSLPQKVLRGSEESSFKQQILDLVNTHSKVAIDMSCTDFVDSSIVTLLLAAEKGSSTNKGMLAILAPNQQALDLFTVTSIDKIIRIVPDENGLTSV